MIDNDLRNTVMQILYVQLTFPLFFLLLFYTARLSKLAITHAFSWPLRWNKVHQPQLSEDYFFAAVATFFVLFWCDFRQGGVAAIV
jgi:hypothetical protein